MVRAHRLVVDVLDGDVECRACAAALLGRREQRRAADGLAHVIAEAEVVDDRRAVLDVPVEADERALPEALGRRAEQLERAGGEQLSERLAVGVDQRGQILDEGAGERVRDHRAHGHDPGRRSDRAASLDVDVLDDRHDLSNPVSGHVSSILRPRRGESPLLLRRRLPVLVHGVSCRRDGGGRAARRGRVASVRAAAGARGRCSRCAATTCGSTGRGTSTRGRRRSAWRSTCRATNPAPPCLSRPACGPRRRGSSARVQARPLRGVLLRRRGHRHRPGDRARRRARGARPGRGGRRRPTTRSSTAGCVPSASEAEAAGVAGVPSLLAEDGRSHWGMGGIERLLAGEPLVPRA